MGNSFVPNDSSRRDVVPRRAPLGFVRLVVVLSALAAPLPARAETDSEADGTADETGGFSTGSSSWEGLSELVRLSEKLLGPERVRVRATLDYDELEAGDALLVLHPEVTLATESLTRFLAAGGRVALLDDFGKSPEFLAKFGIERISPPLDPARRLGGDPDLAIAVPSVQVVAGVERGRHPMTERVGEVITNHPAAFEHPNLTQVLELQDRNGAAVPFAITGIIAEKGRLVAVGDPSIFINLMLRYPGNRAFAEGLLGYLALREETPSGHLWIVSGRFDQRGSFGTSSFADRVEEKLTSARSALGEIEEHGLPPAFALALAAFALLWIARSELPDAFRAAPFRTARSVVPSFARPATVLGQTGLLGRAEVLAAPSTPPVLVLLELLAAVEEALADRAGGLTGKTSGELTEGLARAGLDSEEIGGALGLVDELRRRTKGFENSKAPKTSEAEMKRIHGDAMALLVRLGRAKRSPES